MRDTYFLITNVLTKMELKTSLWLTGKTDISLEFESSCIITAHFSSCPFIPCQAFQAGFPYAAVKTGNCF